MDETKSINNELINQETIKNHDKYTDAYINILDTYKTQLQSSIEAKNDLKKKFFYMIQKILYILISLFVITLVSSFIIFAIMAINNYESIAVVTGAITAIISSFATMILSIFNLPEIIARYLFNKDEDNLMNQIIKNIQDYEINTRSIEYLAALDANQDKISRTNAQSLKKSPKEIGKHPDDLPEDAIETQ